MHNEFRKYAKDRRISGTALDKYGRHLTKSYLEIIPNVVEERSQNMAVMDVYSRLMMDRIIFLGTEIDDQVANIVNAQLLFLESESDTEPIELYINSPGGSVYDGLSIYDTIQLCTPQVHTYVTGMAASMAFVLSISGEPGHRFGLRHSRFMQHQPSGGAYGQESDIDITAREMKKIKKELYEIISQHTGKDIKKVTTDCDRDYWMTAKEAQTYGAIDQILMKRPK